MNRIAICFSAQVRTAVYTIDSIKKFIGPLWDRCDFFCHTWSKDTDKLFGHNIVLHEKKIPVDQETIDKLQSVYRFKKFKMEDYEKVADEKNHQPLFYSWIESLKLKQQYEQENNFKYSLVVKLRLDNIYSDKISLQGLLDQVEPDSLVVNSVMANGSVDDFIFISDGNTSDKMIDWYDPWLESTTSYFAHLEIPDYLKQHNIKLIDLHIDTNLPMGIGTDLGILRRIAVNFDPVQEYGKCVETDKILYWDGPKTLEDVYYLSEDDLLDIARKAKVKYNKLPNVLALFENRI